MEHFESVDYDLNKSCSWSLLSNDPVVFENRLLSEKLVAWGGIVMPHTVALCIAGAFLGVIPTPSQKDGLRKQTHELFRLNAFGTKSATWLEMIQERNVYDYYHRILKKKLNLEATTQLSDIQRHKLVHRWLQTLMLA